MKKKWLFLLLIVTFFIPLMFGINITNNNIKKENTNSIASLYSKDKPAREPIINNTSVLVTGAITATVSYSLTIPEHEDDIEDTIIKSVDVWGPDETQESGDKYYGTAVPTNNGQIGSEGKVYLGNLVTDKVYSGLYITVTYNEGKILNKDNSIDEGKIKSFVPIKSFNSAPIINPTSVVAGKFGSTAIVNYSLTVPRGSDLYKDTVIKKISVTDGKKIYGSTCSVIHNVIDVIPDSGSIEIAGLKPVTIYNNLFIKVTYNNNQALNENGSIPNGNVPNFVTNKEAPQVPKILSTSSQATGSSSATIDYNICVPKNIPIYTETFLSKIEVTDGKNIYGEARTYDGKIPSKGKIYLGGLKFNTKYANLYIKIKYNDNILLNNDGNINNGKIPEFTTLKQTAQPPIINSVSVKDIEPTSANIIYDITLPSNNNTYEDTKIEKISVTDGNKVYGSLNNNNIKVNEKGSIPLTNLSVGTEYTGLYIELRYNNGLIFNGNREIPEGNISKFTTNKLEALPPLVNYLYVNNIDSETATLNYKFTTLVKNPKYEDTIIKKILVTDGDNFYGMLNSLPIPDIGSISLGGLSANSIYSNLYIKVVYNDDKLLNNDGLIASCKIPSFKTNK